MLISRRRAAETAIPGLNRLLRDLSKLTPELRAELRDASQAIANKWMAPAFRLAAINYAGPWGPTLAETVRAHRDRIPAVDIGYEGKAWRLEGGATPNWVRYPSHSGEKGQSFAPFKRTNWLDKAGPEYIPHAYDEWIAAINNVCRDFNNGPDY